MGKRQFRGDSRKRNRSKSIHTSAPTALDSEKKPMVSVKTENSSEGPAIGIDLGTTFSCVAVVHNGKVKTIPNELGNLTTPSFVAFYESQRLIGDAAKKHRAANAENTIFDAKRLIGRKFDDPVVQKDMKQWPFKVINVNGMPKIEITYKGEVIQFSAEEVCAMVLGKMKEAAESFLNAKVTNAVVTVPAHFNDMQRKATKDAATIAGLNVTRIISEPTAAAITYGLNNNTKTARNILVYDLGGGTLDVSILTVHENRFVVKATYGDPHLGGEDFDGRLLDDLIAKFKQKNGIDVSGNKKALRQLRKKCEMAKRTLSSSIETVIEIDSLCNEIDLFERVTRTHFEEICADLFNLTMKTVEGALKEVDMTRADIDTIVLAGGSTRIPKIRQLLQGLFPGKEICQSINADEAVAHGAAILAAIVHGGATSEMENMNLVEVTPLTLGVAFKRRWLSDSALRMSEVIKRNTCLPVCKSVVYCTVYDNQTRFNIAVLQGEHQLAKDNYEIGKFTINGIPAAPARKEKVEINFSIDENGILTVSAVSESNANARGAITITNVSGSLTKAEIDRMIADAAEFSELDRDAKQRKTARWELEQFCVEMKDKYEQENPQIRDKCTEILTWLSSCNRPTTTQILQWKNELDELIREVPILFR